MNFYTTSVHPPTTHMFFCKCRVCEFCVPVEFDQVTAYELEKFVDIMNCPECKETELKIVSLRT